VSKIVINYTMEKLFILVSSGRGPQIMARNPNLGRETVHTESRNNLNVSFSLDRINATIYHFMC